MDPGYENFVVWCGNEGFPHDQLLVNEILNSYRSPFRDHISTTYSGVHIINKIDTPANYACTAIYVRGVDLGHSPRVFWSIAEVG